MNLLRVNDNVYEVIRRFPTKHNKVNNEEVKKQGYVLINSARAGISFLCTLIPDGEFEDAGVTQLVE